MRKQTTIDRKRAASGERDDDMEVILGAVGSLTNASRPARLVAPRMFHHATVATPSLNDDELPVSNIRIVPNKPYEGTFDMKTWLELKEKANDLCFASRHVACSREIVAKFGKVTAVERSPMVLGHVRVIALSQTEITNPLVVADRPLDNVLVLDRVEDMLHQLTLDRSQLMDGNEPFSGFTLEVMFYSRIQFDFITDSSDLRLAPIGKAKVFFPKQHSKMVVHLDMLRF